MARSQALLADRERRGVRALTLGRGLFVLVLVPTVWAIGASWFEKLATTGIGMAMLLASGASLLVLTRGSPRTVTAVGLVGCALDLAVLATLPVVWHQSVGADAVAPSFMLKTHITVITLAVVGLNAIAIRPLYPMVAAAGGIAVHAALLAYALQDPRSIVSADFVAAAMGPALNLQLTLVAMLVIGVAGAVMGYVTWISRSTLVQGVRLEVANAQLGRYFSPGVVARIAREAESPLATPGRNQPVAVMFCDIRDFTTLTEPLAPGEVVRFLSQYHERMVEVIFRFGGTVDKFIGDGIMVTFGTPDPRPDDAERAVRAGLAMNRALADLNAERASRGMPAIRHGLGLHFGPVIAGTIGPPDRLEYTVIGDVVNVASRIQEACKATGEVLLISDSVRTLLPDGFRLRPLSERQLRGRRTPVRLYAVDDGPTDAA